MMRSPERSPTTSANVPFSSRSAASPQRRYASTSSSASVEAETRRRCSISPRLWRMPSKNAEHDPRRARSGHQAAPALPCGPPSSAWLSSSSPLVEAMRSQSGYGRFCCSDAGSGGSPARIALHKPHLRQLIDNLVKVVPELVLGDLELLQHLVSRLLEIRAAVEQLPQAGSGLIQRVDPVGLQLDQDNLVTNALGDRIRTHPNAFRGVASPPATDFSLYHRSSTSPAYRSQCCASDTRRLPQMLPGRLAPGRERVLRSRAWIGGQSDGVGD